MRLLVVADDDIVRRAWLIRALSGLGQILELGCGAKLESLLLQEMVPDLVVAGATMAPPTGLHVLATARAAGSRTPFIVIADFQNEHVRGFVSDRDGTRVEDRVLDRATLRALAEQLLAAERVLA